MFYSFSMELFYMKFFLGTTHTSMHSFPSHFPPIVYIQLLYSVVRWLVQRKQCVEYFLKHCIIDVHKINQHPNEFDNIRKEHYHVLDTSFKVQHNMQDSILRDNHIVSRITHISSTGNWFQTKTQIGRIRLN